MSRVIVLGSLNMDLVVALPRLPGGGETVVGDRLRTFPGGKGANQAVAAVRLGAAVSMIGRVGADVFGDGLLASLTQEGVDVRGVARDFQEPTGAALILVETGGENMIAVAPGANAAVSEAEVQRTVRGLAKGDVLVLQHEVPLSAVAAAVRGARSAGARIILNAAPAARLDPEVLEGLEVLVVNEHEAEAIFSQPARDLRGAKKAARAGVAMGCPAVIVTLGSAGAVLARVGRTQHLEPFHVEAVDATAAGDAFVGALASSLAAGLDLARGAELAGAAGAAAATKFGAQASLPRVSDLKRLFGIEWPVTAGDRVQCEVEVRR